MIILFLHLCVRGPFRLSMIDFYSGIAICDGLTGLFSGWDGHLSCGRRPSYMRLLDSCTFLFF